MQLKDNSTKTIRNIIFTLKNTHFIRGYRSTKNKWPVVNNAL